MSDPVTNAEVEDVLSSIRRLVSEDKRPAQKSKPASPATATPFAAAGKDRLVLTPALRVAGSSPVENRSSDTVRHLPPAQVLRLGEADAVSDEAEPLKAPSSEPTLTDQFRSVSWPAEDGFQFVSRARMAAEKHGTPQIDPDVDDELPDEKPFHPAAQATPDQTRSTVPLSAKIAALETAIGNIAETWEPDDTGTDDYSGTEAQGMAWEDDVERDATGAPLQSRTPEKAPSDALKQDAEEADFDIAEASDEPEPQADEADFGIAEVEDALEPDEADKPVPHARAAFASDETESGAGVSAEDQILDEEALRDLVSEIVRAELQGALGERITRNVRKLVRREIHRALTAQDLE